ncbi:uncharacterized protein LOC128546549 [Mercenaria mercenaria]|uniref:uncharacterized protein LOC128546549 n=1 Tax=Mercenaria mercenaria TaxID=6596 RepID=UPI00234EF001|nr:uncharacterized protein LOC128546549 [Mercenaria mercenaria]
MSLENMSGFLTGQEGKDFFYNEATGKNEPCSDKCDIPSQYEYTCAEKCKFYIPKERVTTMALGVIKETDDKTYLFIISGILIAVVTVIVLGVILKNKLSVLKGTFCRKQSTSHSETGSNEPAEMVTSGHGVHAVRNTVQADRVLTQDTGSAAAWV